MSIQLRSIFVILSALIFAGGISISSSTIAAEPCVSNPELTTGIEFQSEDQDD